VGQAYAPGMPSRPLSPDREAINALHTRLDVEAIDLAQGRAEMPAAVARLAQLVPPGRVDLSTRCWRGSAAGT
jgi:hypothetical protein